MKSGVSVFSAILFILAASPIGHADESGTYTAQSASGGATQPRHAPADTAAPSAPQAAQDLNAD
jgi:hypothetical protein